MKRDNFTQCDEETLKDRVGGRCSNPLCMRDTVGPKANMGSSVSVGEAAHIYAASEGGPRFKTYINVTKNFASGKEKSGFAT
ncbi:MAG: hypothetical protein V8S73_05495 [Lachnospiraceae bacterium]